MINIHKERKKKEADVTQKLTRDQRQRAGSYEARKKELENEGYKCRKKGRRFHVHTTEAKRKLDKKLADVYDRIMRE